MSLFDLFELHSGLTTRDDIPSFFCYVYTVAFSP